MRTGCAGPTTRCGVALKNSSGRARVVDAVVEVAAARDFDSSIRAVRLR